MRQPPDLLRRNQALDILRAIAVVLVLFRHAYVFSDPATPISAFASVLRKGGWVGVDLFFVLSGFLIAQLLFREHRKYGRISYRTFLIRRGFKIYPPYYAMAAVTAVVLALSTPYTSDEIVRWSWPWMLYLQDYVQTPLTLIWGHTWSLAVEEQFYLGLPLLLIALATIRKGRANPFTALPVIFLVIAAACLVMRIANAGPWDGLVHLAPIHVRVDSLFAGVFISYLYHFHTERVVALVNRFRPALIGAGVLLLVPAFMFELSQTPLMYSWGYTLFYAGSAFIALTAAVSVNVRTGLAARTFSYVGSRSYSIYLWHLPIGWFLHEPVAHLKWVPLTWFLPLFITISIVFGIVVADVLELPVLRVRDRWFPSRSV